MHLASLVGSRGRVVAADRHAGRMKRLAGNLERCGFDRVFPLVADMTVPAPLGGSFDRVLVDAPCSNTGVLRRRVEARWRLDRLDLGRMASLQLALLRRGAEATRIGGRLVYSTCSIEADENRGVAMAFLEGRDDFELEGEVTRFPGDTAGDGGYGVALRRRR